jgi:hypothetical protein
MYQGQIDGKGVTAGKDEMVCFSRQQVVRLGEIVSFNPHFSRNCSRPAKQKQQDRSKNKP